MNQTPSVDDPRPWDPLGSRLVFILSPPRSGSTMLQLMLAAHPRITSVSEPHVLVGLPYLGYFDQVEKAPYDVVNTSLGLRSFVDRLPGGEQTYVVACRAYAGTLYEQALRRDPAAVLFVDKTPPNVLQWPFITRLFPAARYVALVRHPVAVLHSVAETFFAGSYQRLAAEWPLLPRYVAAMAAFLRASGVQGQRVRYEDLLADPTTRLRALATFLAVAFDPDMVAYGRVAHERSPMGDQIHAHVLRGPTSSRAGRWVEALRADPSRRRIAQGLVEQLDPADLDTFGYDAAEVFGPLERPAGPGRSARRRPTVYGLERRVYLALRPVARWRVVRWLLTAVRYYCDVLLRG